MFEKILIANRGEIAVRIIRAAHEMGIAVVAVYSDPDRFGPHVRMSDEAYRIGPGPASESYLNIPAIISAAKEAGADAIHPGYGFLSESAGFAQAVQDAGITFVGPPAGVTRLMGDKVAAKTLVGQSGVPLIPGYTGSDQSIDTFRREADRIGYPIMVKAAAGGGGRGMREVARAEELREAIEGATREASSAFGDGTVFLEKRLVGPRHVEVQVLGDKYGNLIHLFERDCSVQRRHQKVLEEAPSPALSDEQRRAICEAGRKAAAAARYENAGTVEFLWSDGEFYFLEMNTRIQVEHGVTELVTGIDLVRAQIEVAAGRHLPWTQDDIGIDGHAIEARLYAEDARAGFLPQFGALEKVLLPLTSSSLRVDSAIENGVEISRYYDPMIAKIMTHEASREAALHTLVSSLEDVVVDGVKTNLDFLLWATGHEDFSAGRATTAFTDQWRDRSVATLPSDISDSWVLGAVAADLRHGGLGAAPWYSPAGWRVGGQDITLAYETAGENVWNVTASRGFGSTWQVTVNGRHYELQLAPTAGDVVMVVTGHQVHTYHVQSGLDTRDFVLSDVKGTRQVRFRRAALLSGASGIGTKQREHAAGANRVTAPMPGTVVKVHVKAGDAVQARQPLMVLEAMKMEHVLEANREGTVREVFHSVGDLVNAGAALIEIGES